MYQKKYGTKSTQHLRYEKLVKSDTWKKILVILTKMVYTVGKLNLGKIFVDSTTITSQKKGDSVDYVRG